MTDASNELPRYAPRRTLPPYRYVPGNAPHPTRDPEGHSFGKDEPAPERPDPDAWRSCDDYLYGVDLFNRGYYWEAHEAWEGLWHAAGRRGATADFLKALIALAAAGVKAAEGMPGGVSAHGGRAAALLSGVGGDSARFMGLDLSKLCKTARALEADPGALGAAPAPLPPLLPD